MPAFNAGAIDEGRDGYSHAMRDNGRNTWKVIVNQFNVMVGTLRVYTLRGGVMVVLDDVIIIRSYNTYFVDTDRFRGRRVGF